MSIQSLTESKAMHTPGPWTSTLRPVPDGGCIGYVKADTGHLEIAVIYGADDNRQVANAHLIAAAPELLAVARRIAAHFEGTDSPIGAAAVAAIAKAEGRS